VIPPRSSWRLGCLLVLAAAIPGAHAACVGQQTGDLAAMDELAFRDPASALPQLAAAISSASVMPATRRAALHAIAADASRQMGFSRQTITHADAGLALLAAGDMSDLAVRMLPVRALVSTNVGGSDEATVELTRVVDAIGNERPLAMGCLIRDRGWLYFRAGNPDKALDDVVAHLRARGVQSVYFSNDIDGTDAKFAEATGTPEPDGLTPDWLFALITRLGKEFGLCAADCVEVALPLKFKPTVQ
jgi:hypothetical protein